LLLKSANLLLNVANLLKKISKNLPKKPIFYLFLDEKQKTLIKQRISRDLVSFFKITRVNLRTKPAINLAKLCAFFKSPSKNY